MRGDSRLDLVAKSLALVGLGVLAGVGALVNHWPTGPNLPQVAALPPELPAALARPGVPLRISSAQAERGAPAAPHAIVEAVAARAPLPMAAPVVPAARVAILSEAVALRRLPITAGPLEAWGGADRVTLDPLMEPLPEARHALLATGALDEQADLEPPFVPAAVSDDGLLASVFKKTGSSLTGSLGKASTAIVGAFKAAGGAVKHVF